MESESKKIIKVLVVEDSPSMCKVMASILNIDPGIIVVGTAANGKEAVELVSKLKPDIITMDIHMPVMDGFESTKQIMAYNPTPILIVAASVYTQGMDKVFKAISFGALDVIDKSELEIGGKKNDIEGLIEKIKFLSTIKVMHHPLAKLEVKRDKEIKVMEVGRENVLGRIVAIVSSTGGPEALLKILKKFPKNFPCGIVIVQHITSGFEGGLAEWLNSECQIKVKVAADSEEIQPGVAYIAPCDLQMRVQEGATIRLFNEPARDGQRPSGDILLESVAGVYKEKAVAVILTGMGSDGANGIRAVKGAHGRTIAQDEASCIVFGMPKVAIAMGAVDKVLPLERIAEEIVLNLTQAILGCGGSKEGH